MSDLRDKLATLFDDSEADWNDENFLSLLEDKVWRAVSPEVERLERVAIAARDVLTTVHEGFREDIDFIPLWRALIEAGLMPVDPADWVDEEAPVPPVSAHPVSGTEGTGG